MPTGEERVERRLSAILAADVVGYSRLMGLDEEGTLAALKGPAPGRERTKLTGPISAQNPVLLNTMENK